MTRFMILMQWGRVGSNLIMNIIHQSRVGLLSNEVFNRIRDKEEQLAWYQDFYQFAAPEPTHRLIGTKENVLAVADRTAFAERLRADGIKVIRMRRDNLLKAAVSQMRAQAYAALMQERVGKARWAVLKGEEPLGPTAIDVEVLRQRLETMARAREALMGMFEPDEVLDIEYESIVQDLPGVVTTLRRHLDLQQKPDFRVIYEKATPDDLGAAVSNYSEVVEALRDTPFAGMTGTGVSA